jgi:hypothetical protein
MSFLDPGGYDSATALAGDQARRQREQAARRPVLQAALDTAARRAEAGDLAAMTEMIHLLAERHSVRITWRPPDQQAYAYAIGTKAVVIPPIRSATDFAVCLHELGHCVAGPCAGGDHQPQRNGQWRACLRCEQEAWEIAMRMCVFSPAMFAELQRGLTWYRRSTGGPASAAEAVDRTKGTITWADSVQKHKRMRDRHALVACWKTDSRRRV